MGVLTKAKLRRRNSCHFSLLKDMFKTATKRIETIVVRETAVVLAGVQNAATDTTQ